MFVSWRRIRLRDAAHAYATRTLVNTYLAERRVRRVEEVLTASVPDRRRERGRAGRGGHRRAGCARRRGQTGSGRAAG